MNVESLLKQLLTFKNLPTYQFERRINVFVVYYLEDYIKSLHNEGGTYKMIYPEFPLSLHDDDNRETLHSNYADYLFYNSSTRKAFFLEFKTDSISVNKKQFDYYYNKCAERWAKRLHYYVTKAKGGTHQKKFAYGLKFLKEQAPDLVGCEAYDPPAEMLRPKVVGINKYFQGLCFNPPKDIELTFKYLAPTASKDKIGKIRSEITPGLHTYYSGFIDLADFGRFVL